MMKKIIELAHRFGKYMERGLNEAAKADPSWGFLRPGMAW